MTKKEFAARLLFWLLPWPLSKVLPRSLRIYYFGPLGEPPFPPALPPGASPYPIPRQPPIPNPLHGVFSPYYSSLFGGCSGGVSSRGLAPYVEVWFEERFADLTTNDWEDGSSTPCVVKCESLSLVLEGPDVAGYAEAYRIDARTWPTDYELSFHITWYQNPLSSPNVVLEFFTGVHDVYFCFDQAKRFRFLTSSGLTEISIDSIVGTYKIQVISGVAKFWKNSVLLVEDLSLEEYTGSAGYMMIDAYRETEVHVNTVKIVEIFP